MRSGCFQVDRRPDDHCRFESASFDDVVVDDSNEDDDDDNDGDDN